MAKSRLVVVFVTIVLLITVLPPFIPDAPVKGGVTKYGNGDLEVDGVTHTIDMDGTYQHEGNLTVINNGKLIIRDTIFNFLTPNYERHIKIESGGTLSLENSTMTVNLDSINFRETLDIDVSGNGKFEMVDSYLLCDGILDVDNGNVYIRDSTIARNTDDGGINDTCVDISLKSASYMKITDSKINDYPILANITIDGTSTFVAINTYLDIDFEKLSTKPSRLEIKGSAKAYLYGVTTVEPTNFPPDASAIAITGANAIAEIYKWVGLKVEDAAGIPVGGASITVRNLTKSEPVGTPRSEILDYIGRTSTTWNVSAKDGTTYFPLRTNILRYGGGDPTNNYTGTYNVTAELESYEPKAQAGLSFSSYPRLLASENIINATLLFSEIVPPDLNNHFSDRPPVKIMGNTKFTKPVQIQENIIIDGGTLTLDGTDMKFTQDGSEMFFIFIKSGGKLIIKDSNVWDAKGLGFPIYNFGGTISVSNSILNNKGTIIVLSGGDLNFDATDFTGDFYVKSQGSNVTITDDSYLETKKVTFNSATVRIEDTILNATEPVKTTDVMFTAINTSFTHILEFNGNSEAELINVNSSSLSVNDNSIVERGWWLIANVTDGGDNAVPDATVDVYNYTLPGGELKLYSNGTTKVTGQAIIKVIGEIITPTQTLKGIERSYYLNATYKEKEYVSDSEGFSSPSTNIMKKVSFTQLPDLKVEGLTITGERTEGKMLKFKATIKNIGTFEARDITVRFLVDNEMIVADQPIGYLEKNKATSVEAQWSAELGEFPVSIMVDPTESIGESDEFNNYYNTTLEVQTGAPDITVHAGDINFNPVKPTLEQTINISIAVGNTGDTNPIHFDDNEVYVDLYLGDVIPANKIKNTTTITSIEPNSYAYVYAELTFNVTGTYTITAIATTSLDSDMTNNIGSAQFTVYDYADLILKGVDITFSPGAEVAKGTEVTIWADVLNYGESAAHNVKVEFYEGSPDEGSSTLLGSDTLDIVEAGGSSEAQFIFSPSTTGPHNIYVVVDSMNTTRELSEKNNVANNTLRVLKEPDLYVDPAKISLYSSVPGHIVEDEMITITADVANIGETPAENFMVHFYYKSTKTGPIGTASVTKLIAGNTTTVEINWNPPEVGLFNIIVWADALQTVVEDNEENNQNIKIIQVYSKPDLTMDPEDFTTDISADPVVVPYSKVVKINTTIRNRGDTDSSSFWVQFFDGNPTTTGIQIGLNKRVAGIPSGELRSVEIEWTAIPGGNHNIYFLIDAYNEIEESNEGNNSMVLNIYVETVPDLKVMPEDINILAGAYGKKGQATDINVTIHNDGDTDSDDFYAQFFLGDPLHDTTFELLEKVKVTGIAGGMVGYAEITWTPEDFGMQKIYVWVDREETIFELSDNNNVAGKTFEVLFSAPDVTAYANEIKILEAGTETQATSYQTGTSYMFTFKIHNVGDETITDFNVSVTYTGPGETGGFLGETEHQLISSIETNSFVNFEEAWTPAFDGYYVFTITLDSSEQYREYNETDNIITTEPLKVNVKPNFSVIRANVFISNTEPNIGEMVTIEITVTATGNYSIGDQTPPLSMTMTVDGTPQPTATATITNGQAVFTFEWTPDTGGFPILEFTIKPDDRIKETTDADNTVTINDILVGGAAQADDKEEEGSSMMLLIIIIIIIIVVIVVLLLIMKKRKGKEPIECPECGEMVPAGETECPECGAEILPPPEEVECSKCGALITTEDETCPECNEPNEAYVPPVVGEGEEGVEGEVPAPETPQAVPGAAPKKGRKPKGKAAAAAPGPTPAPVPQAAPGAAPAPAPAAPGMPEDDLAGLDDIEMMGEEGEGEAECYKCGARVPLSVPKCPVCGADFE
ncbi:MAG: zinc ribbon domain-containing protein [Thermoplasmata archaeon]|nr:MAG: zinc ribbon domain-containing protein [Thermoplasmata archaeon]